LVVAAVAVHFAYGGVEVEQISFHSPEHRVIGYAVFPAPILPTLTLVPEHPGWNNVLPLNAVSPRLLLAGFIPAGLRINPAARLPSPIPLATTVELAICALGTIEEDLLLGHYLRRCEV